MRCAVSLGLAVILCSSGCATPAAECISRLGRPLHALREGSAAEAEAELARAREELAASPDDPERFIWVGRRLGYLWRMNEAVDVYTRGLDALPRPLEVASAAEAGRVALARAALLRHRGHRQISLREFSKARRDLREAAELIRGLPEVIEADGQPNAQNIPLGTLAFNTWYHLALAHYFQRDFASAAEAWKQTGLHTRGLADNDLAVAYWSWLTLRQLQRDEEARACLAIADRHPDPNDPTIIENHAYHRLVLLFAGRATPDEVRVWAAGRAQDEATTGYGIGMWHALTGGASASAEAERTFERVVAGESWPAFGFIGAEVELESRARTATRATPDLRMASDVGRR